ncbi:putative alkyl/aryl-sulfatase YjcS [Pecten maximus]|uniref:putative alkyl/aryl-sulfatase YjcS n=1 Tax=Pecten maximus TaxID=6579 RepID=UPI0014581FCB|nr:putative alkyl/aryl-sulfatase YjcS [Pecten maximus]
MLLNSSYLKELSLSNYLKMHVLELILITVTLCAGYIQGQYAGAAGLRGSYQGRAGNYQGGMGYLRSGGGYPGSWSDYSGQIPRIRRAVVGDTRKIEKVNDNVYVATGGQSLGNSIMVIAPDGLIIVDTADSHQAASLMLEDFRNITSAPIKAIIYTHHHMDHTGGATAFVENSTSPPDIWAYKDLPKDLEDYFAYASSARYARSMRQFGVFLNGSKNSVDFGKEGATFGFIYPNKFLNDTEMDVVIAGLKVRLVRIVGETNDHMGVYIPEWNMFMSGDTYYEAFPNIYTIRGAKVRDTKAWYQSLDYIIDLNLTYLVPSHLSPIIGQQTILDTLIPHRDGIQYIHDQALRYINKGLAPDEVVRKVKLPPSLVNVSSLYEEYGMVGWSVKGVFQMYLGWFSGDPMDLFPLTVNEKAQHMADLAGGANNLVTAARSAQDQGNSQWALELASYALALNGSDEMAKMVKVDSLNAIADQQINTNAKNYLRTAALETTGQLDFSDQATVTADHIKTFGIEHLFDMLPTAFMPEVCENDTFTILLNFTDTGKTFSLQNRNSVLVVRKDKIPENYSLGMDTTEEKFKNFVMTRITQRQKTEVLFSSYGFRFLRKCFEFGKM